MVPAYSILSTLIVLDLPNVMKESHESVQANQR